MALLDGEGTCPVYGLGRLSLGGTRLPTCGSARRLGRFTVCTADFRAGEAIKSLAGWPCVTSPYHKLNDSRVDCFISNALSFL